MLTLAALARRSEYALHPPAGHDRTGDDSVPVDRAALLTRADWPGESFAGTLLVCEPDSIAPDRAATVLGRLADRRAAGLVVADAEGRALPPPWSRRPGRRPFRCCAPPSRRRSGGTP
ncbi:MULTISPECIES: hypothetical protein [unclassified Streptomyces]|uniref:hypothetical protein n=1 Tax=unclassified Streptomyces TaxID=2593676 RepID=UPI000DAC392A|nr:MULTISPECIES: hypothetical protein [unclassified Streptomyces]PZT72195.1 hypothetical protein DNK55_26850 [Streptomyces sp. AC1-42T]PZT81484.1 hypothetical protein DNK56_04725 [Streptomyces sp. AC1-42W]